MSSGGGDTFGFRHGLAIAQLVCFSPAILYAWSFRSTGRIGSFCIGVFSILRVVGASTKLASLSSDSSSLRTTNFVCESLGIILLTFLYLEFPKRINQTVPLLSKWYFRAVSIFMLFDIGLSIGGYVTMAGRTDNVLIPTGWTIASSVVVAFVFCYTVGLFIWFWLAKSRHLYSQIEDRLLLAPAICNLPLLIRHVEPLIFVGTSDLFWNQVVGNGFVYLFMILIPEVVIIAVSIWCIRGVEPLPKESENTGGEGHLELSSSASRSELPSGQGTPKRDQLRRRATP